jgi:adenine deaminase
MLAWLKTPEGNWFKEEIAEPEESDEAVRKGLEAPLRRQRQVVAYLASKDANFLFGTDTPSSPTYGNVPGLNGYLEMQNLHNAGLTLAQLFKAATINNARAFHLEADVGSIEPGKLANLVLMKNSPLQDIRAYDSVDTVWVRETGSARQPGRRRLNYSARRARAASYSRLRRSTISPADGMSSIRPTPWPAPQMSRHALALLEPKFIAVLSAVGNASGSRPAATIDFFR